MARGSLNRVVHAISRSSSLWVIDSDKGQGYRRETRRANVLKEPHQGQQPRLHKEIEKRGECKDHDGSENSLFHAGSVGECTEGRLGNDFG